MPVRALSYQASVHTLSNINICFHDLGSASSQHLSGLIGISYLLTVVLLAIPTVLAIVADIPKRLDSGSITNIPTLYVIANFDDNTCTLVTSTFGAELRHWRYGPIVHHKAA